MSKLILRIDASALKESSCLRRFYWNVVDGYRTSINTNDIEFGSAFHEFVKVLKENPDRYDLATQAAKERYSVPMETKGGKGYMTMTYLVETCMRFWQQWVEKDNYKTIVGPDGKPLVELKFSYPYYADDQVEVLLCGTIDDICERNGSYAIRDYKTTSVGKRDQYLAGYELSAQLLFYRLILSYYAKTYPESLFAKLHRENAACFIDAIFLQGASKPPEFARSPIFNFPQAQLDEFEQLVNKRILDLVTYVKAQQLPMREGMINGACQTVYGACKFFGACVQKDEIGRQHILNRYFIQREYNPLKFGAEHEKS